MYEIKLPWHKDKKPQEQNRLTPEQQELYDKINQRTKSHRGPQPSGGRPGQLMGGPFY